MGSKKLLNLSKRYYEFIYKTAPTFATYLGIHKYDHLVGDLSRKAIKNDVIRLKEFKTEAASIKAEVLGKARSDGKGNSFAKIQDWTDYRLLVSDIDANLRLLTQSKDWEKNPNIYVETPLMGIFLLISRDVPSLKDCVRSVTARLNLYPRMLACGRANVKKAPKIYTQISLETLLGAQFFIKRILQELGSRRGLPSKDKRALEDSVQTALTALDCHKEYLTKLLSKPGGDFALGRKLFEQKLKSENFLNLDADGLLRLGKREFARIERELKQTARRLSREKTWPQLVEEYRDLVPEKVKLVDLYKKEVLGLVKFLKKQQIITFPKKQFCIVAETPDFERPTVPYAAYMPPAVFETKQVGFFWVTPVNDAAPPDSQRQQLREHCLPSFMITTLHESYPGHHLQFCIANQVESFVRKHGQSSLLCEGWALYCEQMMGEVGYYTDPKTKLFMLKDELWRAARVIIDVSLHCFGMKPHQAIKLLVEKVKLAPAQAEAEVKRYTMSPTQPMSYLVGKLLILRMREKAKKIWGKNYSLKRFHDGLLSCGTIPQPLIEKELFR